MAEMGKAVVKTPKLKKWQNLRKKHSFPILLTSKTAKNRDLEKKSPYSKQRRT